MPDLTGHHDHNGLLINQGDEVVVAYLPMANPTAWLTELFEFEFCHACGGDADNHVAIPVLGNWFALCNPRRRWRRR